MFLNKIHCPIVAAPKQLEGIYPAIRHGYIQNPLFHITCSNRCQEIYSRYHMLLINKNPLSRRDIWPVETMNEPRIYVPLRTFGKYRITSAL